MPLLGVSPLVALEDLLLPARCPACPARAAPTLCARCRLALDDFALEDGAALELAAGVVGIGGYAYEGVVRDIVHGMKLAGRWAAARGLGELLRTRLALPDPRDVPTTWVPSTPRRRRQRGVDIPRLLAGCGALPLLAKTSERPDQTSLTPRERRRSPRGAFVATAPAPPAVLLVDDVRTTGATATAAALALRDAGARRVLVVTFAVAGEQDALVR